MEKARCYKIAADSFKEIQGLFPDLIMNINYNDKNVVLSMNIPKQDGLDFDIYLNLQNEDELHISTSYIWCRLFPADSPELAETFISAVKGLITGNYRILQFIRKGKVYKSFLQQQRNNDWITIYKQINKFVFPWTRLVQIVIQNKKDK